MDNQNNNEKLNSELNGFDSAVSQNDNPPQESLQQEDLKQENLQQENLQAENESNGYTVTPEGSYYTAEPLNEEAKEEKAAEAEAEPPKPQANPYSSFLPNGSYGNYESGRPAQNNYQTPPVYNPTVKPPKPPKPPKPQKVKKPHNFGIGSLIAVALITAIVSSGCFYAFNSIGSKDNTAKSTSSSASQKSDSAEKVVEINGSIEEIAEAAANKAGSSVVGVQTTFAVQSFFSGQSTSSGSGSGVIYKSDGYIITNYHVIADTLESNNSTITVYLDNDTKNGYKASVINYNISCDLAVLKIDKTGLDAIEIANSDDLKVGQYVVAIGSPGGLEFMGSTTFGIVSGLNRQISTTDGAMKLIQTDAAINPGNSGGALVNTSGKLIGISSSKLVDESYEGMGFAIPVNTVVKICDDLIAHEGEGEAYTGISISSNYTSEVLKYYGYPSGAVVAGVDENSPAAVAGIKRGDIITKFGDTNITEYTDYQTALSNYYPKDTVKVTYYRSGATKTVSLTVGSAN